MILSQELFKTCLKFKIKSFWYYDLESLNINSSKFINRRWYIEKTKKQPHKKKADAPHSSNFWFLVCLPAPRALCWIPSDKVLFSLARLLLTSASGTGMTGFVAFMHYHPY